MFILKKGHQPGVYVPLRALFLVFDQLMYKSAYGQSYRIYDNSPTDNWLTRQLSDSNFSPATNSLTRPLADRTSDRQFFKKLADTHPQNLS